MIVCECTGTSDAEIRRIARRGATRVSQVTAVCGAGGCCQSCRPAIARILKGAAVARAEASAEAATPADDLAVAV
ncbi:MAG TPA: (2Fe-2S)-binding protein [Candidatus Binatia bacterium]|jgi:bacterioferritin-associated ferredoxin